MTQLYKAFLTATLAALCLGLAACASQKEPAEQALAALEAKFKESGADVQKYLPERYAEVEKNLADLRDSMAKKSYGDVVTGAAAAQDALKRAVADARVAHAQAVAAMEDEWNSLVKEMPAMISAMDKKIAAQRGKAPKGMTPEAWKQTIAEYDAARESWSKGAAEMTRANFEATVAAARDAKAKIAAIMQSLDVKTS
jgi:DNA repair exonuclease SbcCD ATPase subunit